MPQCHVLIIDDDTFNLKVLERLLLQEDVACTAVNDASQVEQVATQLPQVDLVLLDLEMPYMDGFQLFEVLTRVLGDQIPVVACSVHLNEIDHVFQAGFHGFLGKPIDLKKFPSQLARILEGQAVWEAE